MTTFLLMGYHLLKKGPKRLIPPRVIPTLLDSWTPRLPDSFFLCPIKGSREKGSILVVTLILGLVLFALGAGYATVALYQSRQLQTKENSFQALYAAEAGISDAISRLTNNQIVLTTGSQTSFKAIHSWGDYSVTVVRNTDTYYTVTATGTSPSSTITQNGLTRTVEVVLYTKIVSIFSYAMYSDKDMSLVGNVPIDSYDSRKGTYASQDVHLDPSNGIFYADDEGDIGSNSNISLNGGVAVYGDAHPGPGSSITMTSGAKVSGETSPSPQKVTFPPVPFPAPPTSNNNSSICSGHGHSCPYTPSGAGSNTGSFSMSGGSQTLSGGTYYFTSLSLAGQSALSISGNVTIYVQKTTGTGSFSSSGQSVINVPSGSTLTIATEGDFSLSGNGINAGSSNSKITVYTQGSTSISGNGILNASDIPADAQIYSTVNSTTTPGKGVAYSGNAAFYGIVYAPYAQVQLSGNAATYGSVIGGQIKMNGNAGFHYDEALGSIPFGSISYVSSSWREIGNR